jgi:hypothetical protein
MLLRCNLLGISTLHIFFLSIAFSSIFAQGGPRTAAPQNSARAIKLPLEQWLQQEERTEMPWRVSLSRPILTYQLRYLVRVSAELPADLLQKASVPHDLHFIVKVSPEHGAWDLEESYSRFRVQDKLDPHSELQMLAELYLRPGVYTVATIAYDAVSGRRNLAFNRIQVGDSDHDPFPELLGSLPAVQFLAPPDNAAPLGGGRILLSIVTARPVQLNLILDLSTREEETDDADLPRFAYPYPPYSSNPDATTPSASRKADRGKRANQEAYEQSRLLQTASLLSAISLKQGCIQVAAFDILRQRAVMPFTSAEQVKWGRIRDEILAPDHAMVSVTDLKGRRDAAKFFEQELEQTLAQPPGCEPKLQNPLQVVAILSRGISFPSGSDKPKVRPGCNCRIIYLQQSDREGYGGADLKNLLKPLSPMVLEFDNPQDFRLKLFQFTRAIEKLP